MKKNHVDQLGGAFLPVIVLLWALIAGAYFFNQYRQDRDAKQYEREVAAIEAEKKAANLAQIEAERKKAANLAQIEAEKKAANLAQIEVENSNLKLRAEKDKAADQYSKSLKAIDDIYQRWKDGLQIAHSTGRGNLAQPVANLQVIRNDARNIVAPQCLESAAVELAYGMGLVVEGFIEFMQNRFKVGNELANIKFDQAKSNFVQFENSRRLCPRQI